MINYGTISVTQRTATGMDQSETTKVYVVKGVYGHDDIGIMSHEDAVEMEQYCNAEIVGYYSITHPWLLWGSWEENFSNFCRIALNHMDDAGLLVQNDFGTNFLR